MEYSVRDIVAEGVAMQGTPRHVGQFIGMVGGRMLAKVAERAAARGDTLAWTTASVAVSRYAAQEWQVEATVLSVDAEVPTAVNDGMVSPTDHWRGRAVSAEAQVAGALGVLARGSADPLVRRAVAILSGVDDEDPGDPWRHA